MIYPKKPISTRKVTLTTSQPFHDRFPVNPSHEIVKLLPSLLPAIPGHATIVRLITYPEAIRVAYNDVHTLVPALLTSYIDSIDLVLHIGMASGRAYYSLERLAHRDGYSKNADVDGKHLPPDSGAVEFPDCKHILTTTLEYDEVLAGWQRNLCETPDSPPLVPAEESNDPGHYLCDYIYFNSLAWFARRNEQVSDGRVEDRPVLFLHVPGESDPETLRKGVLATTALLRSMADSWSVSKRYQEAIHLPDGAAKVGI
jgi:pyroglutamyl-peptidase